jgi:hypothetical protein
MRPALCAGALALGLVACVTTSRGATNSPQSDAVSTQTAAGPHSHGCPVFPASDPAYNQDISHAAVDPNSATYVASLGPNRSWDNDTIEYLNISNRAPAVSVRRKVAWHSMPSQPWQPDYRIEAVSDAHSFVLDVPTCHIYELYNTSYDGALSAYSGGNWDLRQPFVPNPLGKSSAVASGLSMFAGAVKYDELASGHILHTLFLIAPRNTLSQWNFVRPASSTDGIPYRGVGSMQLPYGAKLRLRPDYPENGLGPQATAVVHALKTYGAILGDTGCCYKFVFMNDLSTKNAFDYDDLRSLDAITPQDWQVIALPQVYAVPGH